MKIDEAKAAIAAFEANHDELKLPADELSDFRNDLATIKAQLAKATPSHSISRSRSLRSEYPEGAIGGVVTASIITALAGR